MPATSDVDVLLNKLPYLRWKRIKNRAEELISEESGMNNTTKFTLKRSVNNIIDEAEAAGIKAVENLNGKYGQKTKHSGLHYAEELHMDRDHELFDLFYYKICELSNCSCSVREHWNYAMTLSNRHSQNIYYILREKGGHHRRIRKAYLKGYLDVLKSHGFDGYLKMVGKL